MSRIEPHLSAADAKTWFIMKAKWNGFPWKSRFFHHSLRKMFTIRARRVLETLKRTLLLLFGCWELFNSFTDESFPFRRIRAAWSCCWAMIKNFFICSFNFFSLATFILFLFRGPDVSQDNNESYFISRKRIWNAPERATTRSENEKKKIEKWKNAT